MIRGLARRSLNLPTLCLSVCLSVILVEDSTGYYGVLLLVLVLLSVSSHSLPSPLCLSYRFLVIITTLVVLLLLSITSLSEHRQPFFLFPPFPCLPFHSLSFSSLLLPFHLSSPFSHLATGLNLLGSCSLPFVSLRRASFTFETWKPAGPVHPNSRFFCCRDNPPSSSSSSSPISAWSVVHREAGSS